MERLSVPFSLFDLRNDWSDFDEILCGGGLLHKKFSVEFNFGSYRSDLVPPLLQTEIELGDVLSHKLFAHNVERTSR